MRVVGKGIETSPWDDGTLGNTGLLGRLWSEPSTKHVQLAWSRVHLRDPGRVAIGERDLVPTLPRGKRVSVGLMKVGRVLWHHRDERTESDRGTDSGPRLSDELGGNTAPW
jgi:hypothetical protein